MSRRPSRPSTTRSLAFAVAGVLFASTAAMAAAPTSAPTAKPMHPAAANPFAAPASSTSAQAKSVFQAPPAAAPPTTLLAPSAAPVNTLAAAHAQPLATVPSAASSAGSASQALLAADANGGESDELGGTETGIISKVQAKIALVKSLSDLSKAQADSKVAALKSQADIAKATQDLDAAKAGGAAGAAPGHAGAAGAAAQASYPTYTTSTYQFGKVSYAMVMIDGARMLAVPGETLPGGIKVLSISQDGVHLRRKGGHTFVAPIAGGGLLSQ